MPTYAERHDGQVAHITEHQTAFDNHAGGDISSYLIDYAGEHHDVYQRLCGDLQIEPRPELIHPDPYGDT